MIAKVFQGATNRSLGEHGIGLRRSLNQCSKQLLCGQPWGVLDMLITERPLPLFRWNGMHFRLVVEEESNTISAGLNEIKMPGGVHLTSKG